MIKSSTFDYLRHRELQAVGLQYAKRKEWTYEGERTRVLTQVAIDGYCARINAERMFVRKSWA
jgi:hypothetical protein